MEPQDAWRAAGAVEPSDLRPDPEDGDRTLSFETTDDGTAWVTDDSHRISDVVRAVASLATKQWIRRSSISGTNA